MRGMEGGGEKGCREAYLDSSSVESRGLKMLKELQCMSQGLTRHAGCRRWGAGSVSTSSRSQRGTWKPSHLSPYPLTLPELLKQRG